MQGRSYGRYGLTLRITQKNLCALHPTGGFASRLRQPVQITAILAGKAQPRTSTDKGHRQWPPSGGMTIEYRTTGSIAILFRNRYTSLCFLDEMYKTPSVG